MRIQSVGLSSKMVAVKQVGRPSNEKRRLGLLFFKHSLKSSLTDEYEFYYPYFQELLDIDSFWWGNVSSGGRSRPLLSGELLETGSSILGSSSDVASITSAKQDL